MSQIAQVAETFGVDWPHLLAQCVSFGIVCLILQRLAYQPILTLLAARREQIATGIAKAETIKAELARIEAERIEVLQKAAAEGRALVEDARAAAARVTADEVRKAAAAAEQIVAKAREAAEHERSAVLAEARRQIGRLVIDTTASVTGKILTPDDHKRLAEETASRLAVM
jgi:F-type H+-transporting ATPase subunit b